ncbi:MAG: efflux RND transporter periplasmic adaptor subunit [Gemmatimonadota bacterium]|jgi:RND family efflux transporter MFP subunit
MALSRRTLSILTVLLVVGLLGGGIWWRLRPEPEDGGEARASEATETAEAAGVEVQSAASQFSTDIPQPVEGAEVVRDTLWVSVRASGRAAAFSRAPVQAQVAGVVQAVPVRENSVVQAGQPILQIDTTELALELARAESELLNAQAEYERLIFGGGEIDDEEVRRERERVARARSGLNSAEVSVRQARLDLERTTVRAPFAGRVADLEVVAGQHVSSGTELMTVVDLDPIRVEAEVLEAKLGLLEEGRRGTVTFSAFPGEEFSGRITTINPVVDPTKRTGRVTILLDNPGGRIKPGMYAEVSLEAQSFPDRVLVPRSAILERGEGRRRTMLFVYEEEGGEGLAKWRYVTTGQENERFVEIVPSDEGMVEPGEVVLVDGHHYLAHDTRVRLVENVEAEGGRPGR